MYTDDVNQPERTKLFSFFSFFLFSVATWPQLYKSGPRRVWTRPRMVTVLKEGWLLKRSEWLKKWNRRYFTLTRRTVAGVASHELTYTKAARSTGTGPDADRGGWTLDRSDYGAPEMKDVSGEKETEQTIQLVARSLKSLAGCKSAAVAVGCEFSGAQGRQAERRLATAKAVKPEKVLLRAEVAADFDAWLGLLVESISSSGESEGGGAISSSRRSAPPSLPDRASGAYSATAEDEQMRLALALSVADAGAGAGSPAPRSSAAGYPNVTASYPARASGAAHGDEAEQLRLALALSRQASRSEYPASLGQSGSSPSSSARGGSTPSFARPSPAYAASSPGYSYAHASPSTCAPPAATYAPAHSTAFAAAPPPVYAPPPPAYAPAVPPASVIVVDATAVSVQPSPPPSPPPQQRYQHVQQPPPPTYTPPPPQQAHTWTCSACTYANQQGAAACEVCATPR
jgi:hypothetical protein